MKKLSVRLSLLCLLALLLVPFAGCKREEGGDDTPATSDSTMTTDTMTTEPMTTTTDMGTDTMTSEPMTTESTPPAGQ